ncbi:MAG: hypothetical protein V4450_04755 [Bacteroidota bacterium]
MKQLIVLLLVFVFVGKSPALSATLSTKISQGFLSIKTTDTEKKTAQPDQQSANTDADEPDDVKLPVCSVLTLAPFPSGLSNPSGFYCSGDTPLQILSVTTPPPEL